MNDIYHILERLDSISEGLDRDQDKAKPWQGNTQPETPHVVTWWARKRKKLI